jgi:hypothetical protein
MSNVVTLAGSRGYQDIGTVGQNVQQLAGNIQSINEILDVGLRNTRDYLNGFVRVSDLITLGLAALINGNQLVLVTPLYPSMTVGQLPTGQNQGARGFVTDATAITFLTTVVGGGTYKVPVIFDGTNWVVG